MKTKRNVVCVNVCVLLVSSIAVGQTTKLWPCIDEVAKAESGGHKIRVSAAVSSHAVQKQVLPDISDLAGKELDSLVIVNVILDTNGNVACAEAAQGNTDLFARSIEAAKQWQFMPYQLNNETLVVDTYIQFKYQKDKVEVVVPRR